MNKDIVNEENELGGNIKAGSETENTDTLLEPVYCKEDDQYLGITMEGKVVVLDVSQLEGKRFLEFAEFYKAVEQQLLVSSIIPPNERHKNFMCFRNMGEQKEDYIKNLKAEPEITETVRELAAMCGSELWGLDCRIKTPSSTYEKMCLRGQQEKISDMKDIIRYTSIFPPDKYAEGVNEMLNQFKVRGYNVVKVSNTWIDENTSYKGVNTALEKDGQVFELQFHTAESFELKTTGTHKLYEERRLIANSTDPQHIARVAQIDRICFEMSARLEVPVNVDTIKSIKPLQQETGELQKEGLTAENQHVVFDLDYDDKASIMAEYDKFIQDSCAKEFFYSIKLDINRVIELAELKSSTEYGYNAEVNKMYLEHSPVNINIAALGEKKGLNLMAMDLETFSKVIDNIPDNIVITEDATLNSMRMTYAVNELIDKIAGDLGVEVKLNTDAIVDKLFALVQQEEAYDMADAVNNDILKDSKFDTLKEKFKEILKDIKGTAEDFEKFRDEVRCMTKSLCEHAKEPDEKSTEKKKVSRSEKVI